MVLCFGYFQSISMFLLFLYRETGFITNDLSKDNPPESNSKKDDNVQQDEQNNSSNEGKLSCN